MVNLNSCLSCRSVATLPAGPTTPQTVATAMTAVLSLRSIPLSKQLLQTLHMKLIPECRVDEVTGENSTVVEGRHGCAQDLDHLAKYSVTCKWEL